MARPRVLLPALSLSTLLTACASQPRSSDPASWVQINGGAPVRLFFETPQPGQRLAYGEFEPGEYRLRFGAGEAEAEPVRLYRKVDLEPDLHGDYILQIETAGVYQILLNQGDEPHFRVIKRAAPKPAEVKNTTAQATSTGVCAPAIEEQSIQVAPVFKEGEWVRDFYSGRRAQVIDGKISLTPAADSEGLMLLEADTATPQPFTWDNATVYFALTDRFANGRTDNDHSYGRKADGAEEIGTFHGGDFAGLTAKLDYLQSLGVNALWVSPPFEQIHGWVGGGDRGDFPHYGYHGYYILDFTRLDANMGTEAELKTLIEQAHKRGIRVLFDVVMNHPGYATLQDMQDFGFGGLFDGFEQYLPPRWGDWKSSGNENFHGYHANINYDHAKWADWWGRDWVRAGIYDYDSPPNAGVDPIKGSLAFLPDFKTESDQTVSLPAFLRSKADTGARDLPNATVRDYLVSWLTKWVRDYGLDGFRVDTVKHVEPASWLMLKREAAAALTQYRSQHGESEGFSDPFWMVGEVFPHDVSKSAYFDAGFDAVINFDFQRKHARQGADCLSNLEPVYNDYAEKLNKDPDFNVMSYISSHDTQLFSTLARQSPELQKRVAAALLLAPGAVQIYYGDESLRRFGPTGSDPSQGTRSDMNWADIDAGAVDAVLSHWRKLGQFRHRHAAIGAGQHQKLSEAPYAFARTHGEDRVIIVSAERGR
ncbi:Glycosidase [Hahella chejuensis KCTC 2396]|uniref:Glycosidase n=1 Tax=Hahella chejuensis (strain KCTC 2396) TaxID=349521 RepID=Q2SPS5_HAHCH|nr:alpha-amylase [Hahella chejuensis]ABC27349.1 Glycosidase [Hahella chejuensis KCTC 2396]